MRSSRAPVRARNPHHALIAAASAIPGGSKCRFEGKGKRGAVAVHSHASFTTRTNDGLVQPSAGERDTAAGIGIHGGGEGAVGLKTVGGNDRWLEPGEGGKCLESLGSFDGYERWGAGCYCASAEPTLAMTGRGRPSMLLRTQGLFPLVYSTCWCSTIDSPSAVNPIPQRPIARPPQSRHRGSADHGSTPRLAIILVCTRHPDSSGGDVDDTTLTETGSRDTQAPQTLSRWRPRPSGVNPDEARLPPASRARQ